ncbi:hypothetical protein [Pelobacter propionicus]|uniref:Uncharacterized protein n=1 Tax=Pelobacter propionicus (strain DSM 2379 / NBRC 103807 / OttBd1) TaxID=338966 RepID=A1ALI6_PELPD|nr:hypothetical protein [Pelobacter propionicus]ABK98206.1 hypothetical protein Ppro_0575 [Pelobacter propionicus DSM 2379]
MKPTLFRLIITTTLALAALSLNPYHGRAVEIVPKIGAVSATRWRPVSPSLTRFDQDQARIDRLLLDSQGKSIDTSLAKRLRSELSGARGLVQGIRRMERHQLYNRAQWRLQAAQLKERIDRLSALKSELENSQSSAELNMIDMQSAMSARQAAVQLAANLIGQLSDAQSAIVSNIK